MFAFGEIGNKMLLRFDTRGSSCDSDAGVVSRFDVSLVGKWVDSAGMEGNRCERQSHVHSPTAVKQNTNSAILQN